MKAVDSSLFAPLGQCLCRPDRQRRQAAAPGAGAAGVAGARMTQTVQRPLLEPAYDQVMSLAASVEMLHTATLVHDDVIDGALLRRGAPTLNAFWNRGATVLAGNYMFARAASFAAETANPRVIHIFSDTLETIVDGELRQLSARHNFRQDKDELLPAHLCQDGQPLCCGDRSRGRAWPGCPKRKCSASATMATTWAWPFRSWTTFWTSPARRDVGQTGRQRPARGHVDAALLLLSAKPSPSRSTAGAAGADRRPRRHRAECGLAMRW